MDDLFERGCFTLIWFSLAIIAVAYLMEGNGSAGPSNPVWPFISSLRDFFIGAWVLLLGLGALAGLVALCAHIRILDSQSFSSLSDDMPTLKQIKLSDIQVKETEEARLERARKKDERLKKELAEHEKRKREEEEKEKRQLELRRAKSSEEVIEDALDDF